MSHLKCTEHKNVHSFHQVDILKEQKINIGKLPFIIVWDNFMFMFKSLFINYKLESDLCLAAKHQKTNSLKWTSLTFDNVKTISFR